MLIDAGSVWTSVNGVIGRVFGSGKNSVFFPAAGLNHDGESRINSGKVGFYWSSKYGYDSDNDALYGWNMWVDDERAVVVPGGFARPAKGVSVAGSPCRCVRQ